jgi:hypothetical protein
MWTGIMAVKEIVLAYAFQSKLPISDIDALA